MREQTSYTQLKNCASNMQIFGNNLIFCEFKLNKYFIYMLV